MNKKYAEYINYVIGGSRHLSFNSNKNAFEVSDYYLSWQDLESLNPSLKRMRFNKPPKDLFKTKLDEINLDYFDKFLENYCTDRLENNIPISSTDLISKGEKIHVIGRNLSNNFSLNSEKINYLQSLKDSENPIHQILFKLYKNDNLNLDNLYSTDEGWILCFLDDQIIFSTGLRKKLDFFKLKIKKLIGYVSEDRILGVVKNIRKRGWDENLTWLPHIGSNEIQGSIIGISSKSNSYSLLTGRHRIAAAVYLYKKGELNDDIVLDYPRIIYPWKTWVYDNV